MTGPEAPAADGNITLLLRQAADGDDGAFEAVVEQVYRELEQVASGKLRARYGPALAGATLEPCALVNETLLKLLANPHDFANRRHFFAFSSRVMTRVLLDYERRKAADKRGGGQLRVTLSGVGREQPVEFSALAQVLEQLERHDPRKAEVVRLRFFLGLENREVAETLGISVPTVERDWRFASAWIGARLER